MEFCSGIYLFGWIREWLFLEFWNNELLTGLGATAAAFKNTTPPSFERKDSLNIYRLGLCLPIQKLIFTHIIQHTLWAAGINTHCPDRAALVLISLQLNHTDARLWGWFEKHQTINSLCSHVRGIYQKNLISHFLLLIRFFFNFI
jgi:hypothetical protein